jgi:predicted RNA methylase
LLFLEEQHMADGTLRNLANSGFEPTPLERAWQIVTNLLRFGMSATVFDPTCGEGHFLAHCATIPGTRLYGVEISLERTLEARQRLASATIINAPFEFVSVSKRSMSLVLANPPYYFSDGRRAEYRIIADAGETLVPGGIMVAILPARSGWDTTMMKHWSRYYHRVRCFKFPDGDPHDPGAFQRFSQIVVIGERLETPLEEVNKDIFRAFTAWRWQESKDGAGGTWGQKEPPPELPISLLPDAYLVPESPRLPELIVRKADEATLWAALAASGAHQSAEFVQAATWRPDQQAKRPLMPPLGPAHIAAEVFTGLLDGTPHTGPDGQRYLFSSYVTSKWTQVEIEPERQEEERKSGVVNLTIHRQMDHPVIGVLNLTDGTWRYWQGEEVYTFLAPWLSTFAAKVAEKRRPLYPLDPERWEVERCARIGVDKQLPGAQYPGLVAAQLHRVFAIGRGLDAGEPEAEQADPGTGKTRMSAALAARQADQYHHAQAVRAAEQVGRWKEALALRARSAYPIPGWVRRLRLAWQRNPRARALLDGRQDGPGALPVLVLTPRRVVPTWEHEIMAAWPEAETVQLNHYTDVDRWMQRCAESSAPAVVGILPHSLSRAFGRCWQPAVQERKKFGLDAFELNPPAEEDTEPYYNPKRGKVTAYRNRKTRRFLLRADRPARFSCPSCGKKIWAVPERAKKVKKGRESQEEPTAEVVTSRTYFTQKPRRCDNCHAPLWTQARVIPKQKEKLSREALIAQGYQALSYRAWDEAAERLIQAIKARQASPEATSAVPQVTTGGFPLYRGGSQPKPAREGEPPRPRNPLLSGMRMGKANRNPSAPINAKACRIINAAGEHRGMGPESFSPAEYLSRFYRGCVALTLIDESHNGRGRSTDIAHSFYLAQASAQSHVYLSGTHFGGKLTDFFYYWFRFDPTFWRRLGLGWKDAEKAMDAYGVIERIVRERESEARRGSGKTNLSEAKVPAPGISSKLIPHLLSNIAFLGILDVGAYMPPRVERPIIVPMEIPELDARLTPARTDKKEAEEALLAARRQLVAVKRLEEEGEIIPAEELEAAREDVDTAEVRMQEATEAWQAAERWAVDHDLAGQYDSIVSTLDGWAKEGSSGAAMAKGTIPRWWVVLPCVPPAFTVEQTHRDTWGDVIDTMLLLTTPVLDANYRYPLEVKLREVIAEYLGQGLNCMIYYEQNDDAGRSAAARLEWVLSEFMPWTLANTVEAEDREDAIRGAIQAGCKVVLVPYRRVMEGLNLQDCVDVILWFEMPLNFFHLDQASRRHWRMNRSGPAYLVYLAYAHTAAYSKLCSLAHQSGAAAAFAGEPAQGALAEHVGADKTMLSKVATMLDAQQVGPEALEEETQASLEAAFQRKNDELMATLRRGRQWLGVVDTLEDVLVAVHAAMQNAPERVVEVAAMSAALAVTGPQTDVPEIAAPMSIAALLPEPQPAMDAALPVAAEVIKAGLVDHVEASPLVILEAEGIPLQLWKQDAGMQRPGELQTLWGLPRAKQLDLFALEADASETLAPEGTVGPAPAQEAGLTALVQEVGRQALLIEADPDLAGECIVCGAEVEMYSPEGVAYCQAHYVRPQAAPLFTGRTSADGVLPVAPLVEPGAVEESAPQVAPAHASVGTLTLAGDRLIIHFWQGNRRRAQSLKALCAQFGGEGFKPVNQSWVLAAAALDTVLERFPTLEHGVGCLSRPQIERGRGLTPLEERLQQIRRLYELVFDGRKPNEALLREKAQTVPQAEYWLKQLQLHFKNKRKEEAPIALARA